MREFELRGVEEVAAQAQLLGSGFAVRAGADVGLLGELAGGAVERVAHDRVADGGHVHADLVGAAGFNAHAGPG